MFPALPQGPGLKRASVGFLLGGQDLRVEMGARTIFTDVSVSLQDGSKVGLLGPNGAGKSTLLRVLTQDLKPHAGSVTKESQATVAYLRQTDFSNLEPTVEQTLHPGDEERAWARDPRVRSIHAGVLAGIDLNAQLRGLSGGQRRRVALAECLLADATVTLLDEPTNHLDLEGVKWLAEYLNERYKKGVGALLVITHDRWFLDAVCNQVWEMVPGVEHHDGRENPGRVEFYEGGYAAYILARAERARMAAVAAQKRSNLLRKELAWLRRGAPARTSKPRFRIEAAEALIADVPPPRDTVELTKMATARLGKRVIDLENVSFSYRPQKPIIKNFTLRLAPGARVGILGANGAGKTTLLELLAGRLEPDSGFVRRGKTVQLAELTQHTSELDEVSHLRVVEAVAKVKQALVVGDKEITASQLTQSMGFTRSRAWTPVADISGGERRRLQFMRLLMEEPNVLILDEPTNDLDTDTLAAMEDLLDSFPGTLVVVSHDRYLLERLTDVQYGVFPGGLVRDLPGGVDQYFELAAQFQAEATAPEAPAKPTKPLSGGASAQARREAQKESQRWGRVVEKLRGEIEKMHLEMAEISANPEKLDRLVQLSEETKARQAELDEAEGKWLEAEMRLEEIGN